MDIATLKKTDIFLTDDKTVNCSVLLENGALLTMVLTHYGSERIGMQDYIELRAKQTTVKMINSSIYKSEDQTHIIRSKKINKMQCYNLMYEDICRKINENKPGDSLASIEISSKLMLDLDKKIS